MRESTTDFLRRWAARVSGRPGLFIILAFLLATQNTYASTLIASLFLSKIGADAMPIYYVFFAAVSIPFSVLFTNVIDRFPRSSIFKGMLCIFIVISSGLALLLQLGAAWYYVVYICISLCEHMLYSVYYILFADYFTVTKPREIPAAWPSAWPEAG